MKNTKNPPGQIKLQDYLEQKYPDVMKKKLTFDEWFDKNHRKAVDSACSMDDADSTYYLMRQAWYAGQENK